jgi:hypothetical protein
MFTLIFVYNADQTYFSQVTDYLHKVFRPKTYACNLCNLTHSNFGMKREFKDFIEMIDNIEFFHRDDFFAKFTECKNDKLPAIYLQESGQIDKFAVLISRDEINQINNLDELTRLIRTRINAEISSN